MKSHRDQLFVIDLEAAQNSMEFCQTANGSVSCDPRSSISKTDENGSGKKNSKKKTRHQRKEVDATKASRGKLHGMKRNKRHCSAA